jgi:hypothetical protein
MSPDEMELLEEAFQNPEYTWRTIRGVSEETGIDPEKVQLMVHAHGDEFIKSSATNQLGEALYAARDVYRSKESPVRRILAAFKNRGG